MRSDINASHRDNSAICAGKRKLLTPKMVQARLVYAIVLST